MDKDPYSADEADEEDRPPLTSRRAYTIRWMQIWLVNNAVVWMSVFLWNVLRGEPDNMHAYIMAGVCTVVVTAAAISNILSWKRRKFAVGADQTLRFRQSGCQTALHSPRRAEANEACQPLTHENTRQNQ